MDFNLNEAYIYDLISGAFPRGQNSNSYFNNTCNRPHRVMSIDSYCNVMLCSCSAWLPLPVGNILDFDTLEQVWDNPRAKYLQENIDNKKFSFCAVEHCGIKQRDINEHTYQLMLGIDDSCNLTCPSCRRDKIIHSAGEEFDKKQQSVNHLVKLLEKFTKPIDIKFSTVGDPLASHIYRAFVKEYVPLPTHTFTLSTNGLLIKKHLDDSKLLPAIKYFSISVDAGSADVYHNVRRPGKWSVLLENLDYLKDKKKNVGLNFCVQKSNYKDIPKFVELCSEYGFCGHIHQLDDWGTWNKEPVETPDTWTILNGNYIDHNVFNSTHPEHNNCKNVCQEIKYLQLSNINFSPRVISQLNLI